MHQLSDLFALLDAEELAELFPYRSYVLINRVRAEDVGFECQTHNLERLVEGPELLAEKRSRCILLGKLRERDARELLAFVGREPGEAPFVVLEDLANRPSKTELEKLLAWFGLERPNASATVASEAVEPDESIERIEPSHGLYPYQRKALDRIKEIYCRGSRAFLHMPTGSGKTRTAMALAAHHLRLHEEGLVVWLADTRELCVQARNEFKETWTCVGDRSVKLFTYMGGSKLNLSLVDSGFLVMTLQSATAALRREVDDGIETLSSLAMRRPLVIFDEAHKAAAPKYGRVLDMIGCTTEGSKVLGLSATPGRTTDMSEENRKLVRLFGEKVSLEVEGYASPIEFLEKEGYLARPTFREVPSTFDFSQFKKELGEKGESLSEDRMRAILKLVAEDPDRSILVFEEVKRLIREGHKRILLFAASVEQAHRLAYVMRFFGSNPEEALPYDARAVSSSETPNVERESTVRWFLEPVSEHPDVRILCNYGILTTGFDAPETSAVVIARPTNSLVLYSQMVGRGLRGPRSHGTAEVEIVTIVDRNLPAFWDVYKSFTNWDEAWKPRKWNT